MKLKKKFFEGKKNLKHLFKQKKFFFKKNLKISLEKINKSSPFFLVRIKKFQLVNRLYLTNASHSLV